MTEDCIITSCHMTIIGPHVTLHGGKQQNPEKPVVSNVYVEGQSCLEMATMRSGKKTLVENKESTCVPSYM